MPILTMKPKKKTRMPPPAPKPAPEQRIQTCDWLRASVDPTGSNYITGCLRHERVEKQATSAVVSIADTAWVYCPFCGGKIVPKDSRAAPTAARPPRPVSPIEQAAAAAPSLLGETPRLDAATRVQAMEPSFTFGKHRGATHEDIAKLDPQYIVWAYRNVDNHAGIDRELYLKCAETAAAAGPARAAPRVPYPPPRPSGYFNPADFTDDDIPF